MYCQRMTFFSNAPMNVYTSVKKWMSVWWPALLQGLLLLALWVADVATLVYSYYAASPSGHARELLAAGAALSVPLLTLPAAFSCPGVVEKALFCWLVYLVTWGDGHGEHALGVLHEMQVRRPVAALGDTFLLEYGVTPFSYWAAQGVVLACLVVMICKRARSQQDVHEQEDDEDEEAVVHVADDVEELPLSLQQVKRVALPWIPTRVTVTYYTVEVEEPRPRLSQ